MEMRYLESPSTDPRFNLALEQYVFDRMDRGCNYFMLWQNDNAVIIGKNQNTADEINADFVTAHGIHVVRRLSGGGAVYHDLGNLNFTFIADAGDADALDLHLFCARMADALGKLGVHACVNGRNDITVDGKKFSGNAQYLRGGRVMHHGTILFDSDLEMVAGALRVTNEKLSDKGIRSVRSRVTNLKAYLPETLTLAQFREQLLLSVFEGTRPPIYVFSPEQLAEIEHLKAERYDRQEWNVGASPRYDVRREQRVEGCGTIRLYMELTDGAIASIAFYGDYFGSRDTGELVRALRGCPAQKDALQMALCGLEVRDYVTGLSNETLVALIAG